MIQVDYIIQNGKKIGNNMTLIDKVIELAINYSDRDDE